MINTYSHTFGENCPVCSDSYASGLCALVRIGSGGTFPMFVVRQPAAPLTDEDLANVEARAAFGCDVDCTSVSRLVAEVRRRRAMDAPVTRLLERLRYGDVAYDDGGAMRADLDWLLGGRSKL